MMFVDEVVLADVNTICVEKQVKTSQRYISEKLIEYKFKTKSLELK